MSARFRGPAVEESVACNLIPMIDIMFLLLLFFMLGADMSQRELAEVRLPTGDRCEKDPPIASGAGRTTVNVFHVPTGGGVACALHEAGGECRDPAHWRLAIRGEEFTVDEITLRLKDEAALARTVSTATNAAAGPTLSAREVMIRADEAAPFAVVQRVIESCGAAGLCKVVVGATQPAPR